MNINIFLRENNLVLAIIVKNYDYRQLHVIHNEKEYLLDVNKLIPRGSYLHLWD